MISYITNVIFLLAGVVFLASITKKNIKEGSFWSKAVIGAVIGGLLQWVIGFVLGILMAFIIFIPFLPNFLIYFLGLIVYLVLVFLIWRVVLGYPLNILHMPNDEMGKAIVGLLIVLAIGAMVEWFFISILGLWKLGNLLRLVVSFFLLFFSKSLFEKYME